LLGSIGTIVTAILVFALMVAIHEFGHFGAAKLFKIRVNEFAIGMGPAIWKKRRGETLYSLRAIPMGGFCQMEGETEDSDDERSFNKAAWYKRFVVVIAGATLNIVLGFIIFLCIQASTNTLTTTTISDFTANTNLVNSSFQKGDRIISVGGSRVNIFEDLSFELSRVSENPVEVKAERNGEIITQIVTPSLQEVTYIYGEDEFIAISTINGVEDERQSVDAPDSDEYRALVGTTQTQSRYILGFVPEVQKQTFTGVIKNAFYLTLYNIKIVYVSLYELIRGAVPASQISGPIGIINVIGQASRINLEALFNLIALLTVNLGVMNLLPIPALDGCKLWIILAEAITHRKLKPEHEGIIQLAGFALLIALMLFATYNDIIRIFS